MRKSFDGLAALVQTKFAENPFFGHIFVFRGRRGDILKVLWFDGQDPMLLANHSCTSCHLKQQIWVLAWVSFKWTSPRSMDHF